MSKERISRKWYDSELCLNYNGSIQSRLPKIPNHGEESKFRKLVNGVVPRFAEAFQSRNQQFISRGRIGVVILSVHDEHDNRSFNPAEWNEMILYRIGNDRKMDYDIVVSYLHLKLPMYLKNECLEFMDTRGSVWRVKFDFVEDRDAFLRQFKHLGGTITYLSSDTDMDGKHIPLSIPKSVPAVSSNAIASGTKDAEIDQLKRRVEKLEKMLSKSQL